MYCSSKLPIFNPSTSVELFYYYYIIYIIEKITAVYHKSALGPTGPYLMPTTVKHRTGTFAGKVF